MSKCRTMNHFNRDVSKDIHSFFYQAPKSEFKRFYVWCLFTIHLKKKLEIKFLKRSFKGV